MDDIVKRLRDAARRKWPGEPDQRHSFFGQAADEIEALRERVVGAATALEVIADTAEWHRGDEGRTHLDLAEAVEERYSADFRNRWEMVTGRAWR